jgi:hypothetical protein
MHSLDVAAAACAHPGHPDLSTAVAIFRQEEQSENQRDSLSIVGIGLSCAVRKNITNYTQPIVLH